ncbi:MAG: ComEC/Rec2 family competence protein [Anaerolineaceae bacterium]|nr:MAG: ComEC/Rec2 family competence protein [Anaerolineaceae bacterium]
MRLFWLGLLWLAGIAAGRATPLLTWQWLILVAISLAALLVFHRHQVYRWLFAGILLLTLGAARYQSSKPVFDPNHIASHNDTGRKVTLTGVVIDSPDIRDTYTGLRISAERIRYDGSWATEEVHGLVLLRASRFDDWAYGDRLRAYGNLETPPVFETFSYRDYLARQGVHSLMPFPTVTRISVRQANPLLQLIYDFRNHALETVYNLFPDPEASLLAGILLGVESGISPEVREAFNQTGTTHIIAISGFNITIIAAIFTSTFSRWLGARRGAIAAGVTIALYTILVGADAAVVRAAIMGGLSLLALRLGRQTDGMASLAAAAIAMTALNPLILWDVGFQLSFAATLGLVLYAEPLHNGFLSTVKRHLPEMQAKRLARPISEFVLFTFAAQVTTLPLTAYYFNRISLSALLANPVILPAQPPVMILGGLATLAGSFWLPLGRLIAWIAWPFVAFTIRVVEFFAAWPMAVLPLARVSTLTVTSFYLVLACLAALVKLPPERRPKIISVFTERVSLPAGFTLTALAVSTILMWQMITHRPDGRLHITVLDVGSGESVLIESPTGRFALINGGSSPIALSEALGRRLPILHRHLDWLVIGGTRNDQVAGLADITERYSIGNVLHAGPPGRSAYRHLIDELTEAGRSIILAVAGQTLDLGEGVRLEVLAMGEHGAVLEITYHRARFLLAPGADPALVSEFERKRSIGPVSAILLPDGGNTVVNPYGWLNQLQPMVVLISVEAGNSRGFPSIDVLDTLQGRNVLRTDINGWIELTTDGMRLWAEVERSP